MNIVVATTNFPSDTSPHGGIFLERDVRGLAGRGHQVTCVVARSRLRARSNYSARVPRLRVVEDKYLSLSYVRGLEYWFGSFAQRNSTRTLRRLLEREGGEAEVFYGKFLNTAPVLPHVPAGTARVLGIGEGVDSVQDRLAFFKRGEMGDYLRFADIIEVKNSHVADWLQANYAFCASRIRIVPSGVDTSFFGPGDRTAARAELRLRPDDFVVAFVGARTASKGGDRVIAACAALEGRGVVPILAGPGWESATTVGGRGLGIVEPQTIRTVLHAADVFVLPSLSEGMPNAVLEAMACGLPCIVADRPYNDFLEHDRDCLKIDPSSVGALKGALELLLQSDTLREGLSAGGREVADRLSQEQRVRKLEEIIREAVALRAK